MITSVDDFQATVEFVLEEDDPCAVETIYINTRANAGLGLPYVVGGGECVRVADDFLDAPADLTHEEGDVNASGQDSVCAPGFTIVHEAGAGVAGYFLSEDVVEDNCANS